MPDMTNRLQKGQVWKQMEGSCCGKTDKPLVIKDNGCGSAKDDCLCICSPIHGMCHTASPCCNDSQKGERCYYAWACGNGSAAMGIIVYDGGKKMRTEYMCCVLDKFELVEPTIELQSGAPEAEGMVR